MANNHSINFYSIFRKIILDSKEKENDDRKSLFIDLFYENTSQKIDDIPKTNIRSESQVLTQFLNGKFTSRDELHGRSSKLVSFLENLENYLCKGNNLNEEGFKHICNMLKNWLQNHRYDCKDATNVIENNLNIKEKIINTINGFSLDNDIAEEINERIADKDAITMLTWVMILSLFPEIRGSKESLKNSTIYQCFLNDDSLWGLIKDGIPVEQLDIKRLQKRAVSGLENYSEADLENAVTKGTDDIPNLNNLGKNRLYFIRYILIRAYKEYQENRYKHTKNYILFGIKNVGNNKFDEDLQYELTKLKYLYALSLWKLKEYSKENAVLNDIRRSLIHTEDSKKYRFVAAKVLKLLGTSANRNFNCNDVVNNYIGAYMLTSPTDYMELSSLKNNLAIALRRSMKIGSSCYEYDQGLELRSRVVSENSFKSMRVKMNYASALGLGRQYEKAIEYVTDVYEYRKKLFESNKSNNIKFKDFHAVTTIYARIHIHQAWDRMNADQDIDLKEELSDTDIKLIEVIEHKEVELNLENQVDQDIQLTDYVTRGLYHYLISFSKEDKLDRAKEDFEKSRKISGSVDGKTNTYTIHAALCEIIEGKIHYRCYMKTNDENELKAAAERIGHSFHVINDFYNSLIEKSYFSYYYGVACFHLGALLSLVKHLSLDVKEYVKKELAPLDYLKTAKEMFEKCIEPDISIPVETDGIDWSKINQDAFGLEKETIDKFIELLDSDDVKQKQDIFIKFYTDIFIL